MTPAQRYQQIVLDIEALLSARAVRYFYTRNAEEESPDLKVQCDTLTVVLEQYLKPHLEAFEEAEIFRSGMGFVEIEEEPEGEAVSIGQENQ